MMEEVANSVGLTPMMEEPVANSVELTTMMEEVKMELTPLVSSELSDPRHAQYEWTEFFPFPAVYTSFLIFQVDTFYGEGGGLHFIAENDADKIGQSYSGRKQFFNSIHLHIVLESFVCYPLI